MFQLITLEKIGFVARITLTRPERTNAMNAAMLTEIRRRWTRSSRMTRFAP
jgi:enoyl-CoA hydratase/carnithine racemase